ncbi:phenylacetate--CoA ligase family protein [Oceanidesulfovibrio marinus]|uniref:Phenylacetate--CoA ligase family protein n=1 Tax=Oceanidesulfovibrio marinus TaxID=370038 RepID=A0ABX6NGW4_9BACT|nr:phenylacetate--CoA ligase family protein [Oceanidesulfovibrio marinus]QJT09808.1 phenylacetate--CoA ligase family protein [Oceanidesulfovibrio marinus]
MAYPIAQRMEKRSILPKARALRRAARQPFAERKAQASEMLLDTLRHAQATVPYYRDLFASLSFDPEKVAKDPRYLEDLPWLTKDILQEQGARMLSEDYEYKSLCQCKTGSSTGPSALIYYDPVSRDWTAAHNIVSLWLGGKRRWNSEIHLSTRFIEPQHKIDIRREAFKCFALNRVNVLTDSYSAEGLAPAWDKISKVRPHVVQGHPSTMYALARYVEQLPKHPGKRFNMFVSTGEMLEERQREAIERVLKCRVANRYGAAEFGVMAQELKDRPGNEMLVADFMVWPDVADPDNDGYGELAFTNLRNPSMPLIRYRMGDMGRLEEHDDGWWITDITGRVHDKVSINGDVYPTHYVQDILDRCGHIQDFQIAVRQGEVEELRLVVAEKDWEPIATKVRQNFPDVALRRIRADELLFQGWRGKFRYICNVDAHEPDKEEYVS